MFLDKYLNETYLNMLYENYEEWYIEKLDENNFNKIHQLLQKHNFYYIEDIITNYLEIFTYEEELVENNILKLKEKLGDNFVWEIGNNMLYLEEILPIEE